MGQESPFNEIVRKWHDKWMREGKYEADPDKRKKFFVNFPYPYINGFLHLGHAYTSLKADLIARLKRKLGYNVLFPQAFHATGQPIVAAAQRIREGEPKQIEILKKMGITDIEAFKDPKHWISFFSEKAYEHLNLLGYGIDWRRKFITTEMNPAYDKFIKWQYKKLFEKGYIYKGSHPVVYCPKDKYAIGDHDRAEGEGVVPERVTMIKFKIEDNRFLIAMTFRPETAWGVTNIWVNPKGTYVIYKTSEGEEWVISKDVVQTFQYQDIKGDIVEEISGEELLGKYVENLVTSKKVPILPASFVDTSIGSGIVMSVPSHAPYDYIALRDLEKDSTWSPVVKNIRMISLISVKGYGEFPAKEIVEKSGIRSQEDKDVLEKLTKEIYKVEYHQGILKEVFGEFAGLHVKDAKEKIISYLKERNIAFDFYILPERVICRCLTPAVVKIVKDQWFIKYSDKEWKNKVHNLIDKMTFYPPDLKKIFHDTVDWLEDWAFTRERGLGTRFPYDEDKLIESLSDSTIYMAYYTISKYLQNPSLYGIRVDDIKDSFFDYVFLGYGDKDEVAKENNLSPEILEVIREEFLYWYKGGFDLRISGKDLIKNHLTMMVFHHVAIFPEEFHPRSVGVNGHIMVDGEKMSKSKGNFYTIEQAYHLFGAEEIRFALAYAGNVGIDDPNFETSLIKDIRERLFWFENFALDHYGKGKEDIREIDMWFLQEIKKNTDLFIDNMDNLMTRDAIKSGFYDMINALKWYLRRTQGDVNKEAMMIFIKQQLHILSVIIPHYAQEVWSKIGMHGDIIDMPFIDITIEHNKEIEEFEVFLRNLMEDIEELKSLLERKGKKINEINFVIPDEWKYIVYDLIKGSENLKQVMEHAKKENFFDIDPKLFANFVNKNFTKIKKMPYTQLTRRNEREYLEESISFLEKELNVKLNLLNESECKEEKGKLSLPHKPSLIAK